MLPPPSPSFRPRPRRGGFTLTELMISVVLVLVLLLAVALIFETTSRTIAKGTALQDASRNLDAVRTALAQDFTGTDGINTDLFTNTSGVLPLSEQPYLVLMSNSVATWRNAEAKDADSDASAVFDSSYNPTAPVASDMTNWRDAALTVDRDGDGVDDAFMPGLPDGLRRFRTDSFGFFSIGLFENASRTQSQVNPLSTKSAWIWYGHLKVFNNDYSNEFDTAAYGWPGMPLSSSLSPNINNQFADQFLLGRADILLQDYNASSGTGSTLAASPDTVATPDGRPVAFATRSWATPTDVAVDDLTPLNAFSSFAASAYVDPNTSVQGDEYLTVPTAAQVAVGTPAQTPSLTYGIHDVAAVSTAKMRERLDFLTDPATPSAIFRESFWTDAESAQSVGRSPRTPSATVQQTWWGLMFTDHNRRFWINPFNQQVGGLGAAQRSQLLLEGAQQFVVEYAGDYLQQLPNGDLSDTDNDGLIIEPDGVIDFYVTPAGSRGTRFYGFPRDTTGDGIATVAVTSPDVVPLREFASLLAYEGLPKPPLRHNDVNVAFPHEKLFPVNAPQLQFGTNNADTPQQFIPSAANDRYICAWGPRDLDGLNDAPFNFPLGPRLIRFVVTAADSEGRLEEPVTSEFVFSIPE